LGFPAYQSSWPTLLTFSFGDKNENKTNFYKTIFSGAFLEKNIQLISIAKWQTEKNLITKPQICVYSKFSMLDLSVKKN
jgi:hypothetical protein